MLFKSIFNRYFKEFLVKVVNYITLTKTIKERVKNMEKNKEIILTEEQEKEFTNGKGEEEDE